jgi:cytosine/adenosine deaminase-related metal-dependent hydrolase
VNSTHEAIDYTDIYARYGLLGPKTLFGHCIHLTEREADAMSEAGSIAVHSARHRTSSSAPAFSL